MDNSLVVSVRKREYMMGLIQVCGCRSLRVRREIGQPRGIMGVAKKEGRNGHVMAADMLN
ncbi:hypothetical protein RchiOBHm_Chr5g0043601 [Rosa chinensis]|uniref:Uncharacterized protein n=1 Tax=Rosa chinensis TaxID=74649 RepID=A0A2P6QDD9_ROSCH|nr:hypothetical protein RchiOBHm_Chr5g0043601 [Rosa chinensis]